MAKKETWMPTAAGILDIIAGAVTLLAGLASLIFGVAGRSMMSYWVPYLPPGIPPGIMVAVIVCTAVLFIIIGIVAIVGGIYALRRRIWGLALAGSIVALCPYWILGLAAIVLLALSKKEFE